MHAQPARISQEMIFWLADMLRLNIEVPWSSLHEVEYVFESDQESSSSNLLCSEPTLIETSSSLSIFRIFSFDFSGAYISYSIGFLAAIFIAATVISHCIYFKRRTVPFDNSLTKYSYQAIATMQ
jgi:hypothetical protein